MNKSKKRIALVLFLLLTLFMAGCAGKTGSVDQEAGQVQEQGTEQEGVQSQEQGTEQEGVQSQEQGTEQEGVQPQEQGTDEVVVEESEPEAVMETNQEELQEENGVSTEEYADQYIDLHFHLDGSITPEIARELAELQNIDIPEDEEELRDLLMVPEDCESLNDFLKCFDLPLSLMQTPEGLSEAVRLVADNIASQGVVYAEIRWAPQRHTDLGMTQEEAIQAALSGLEKTDLKANLILCFMRGEGNDALNEETLELAKKYLVEDGGVVAVDIAGAEALYPTENYEELFAKAKEYGIPFTIHAGEAAGPESVAEAVRYGAKRIGHGVRMNQDPEVVKLVKENGIFLEMCPTSNRQTHAVEDMSSYPFMDYLNEGIKVTLNTDDMGIEGTTLAKEFRYMEEEFGLTAAQEKIVLENAVEGAFTTEEVKDQLREKLGLHD